jgi:hypothetical protein
VKTKNFSYCIAAVTILAGGLTFFPGVASAIIYPTLTLVNSASPSSTGNTYQFVFDAPAGYDEDPDPGSTQPLGQLTTSDGTNTCTSSTWTDTGTDGSGGELFDASCAISELEVGGMTVSGQINFSSTGWDPLEGDPPLNSNSITIEPYNATLTLATSTDNPPIAGTNTYDVTLVVPEGAIAPASPVLVSDGSTNCNASLSNPSADGVTYAGNCTLNDETQGMGVLATYDASDSDPNYTYASSNGLTVTDSATLTLATSTGNPPIAGTNTYDVTLTVPVGAIAPSSSPLVSDGVTNCFPFELSPASATTYVGSCTLDDETPGMSVIATYDANDYDPNYSYVSSNGLTVNAAALPDVAVSAAAISNTDVIVVGRSPQSVLWYQQSSGGGTTWTGWTSLPTTDAASAPTVVVSGSDLFVFFRATDNELHYLERVGSTWGTEQNLGGVIAGNPTAAVDGDGRVIVAALNSAGNVFEDSLPSGGPWSGWTSLAGILTGNITLTSLSGNVYLLGLNGTGLGWTIEWTAGSTNTWGAWTSLGGVFATGTTLSGSSYGTALCVQGINPQGILFETTGAGTSFSAWTSLNGILAATPTLAAPTSGLFMFDVNSSGLLWDQEDTSSWQGWNPLSGVLEGSPVAVAASANVFVFGLNDAGNLWFRQWNGTSFGPWTDLGGILSTA